MSLFIKADGCDIEYTVDGSGPSLVVLHGWGCDCSTMRVLIEALAEDHTVYAPSFPGHGASSPIDGIWDIDRYAAVTLAFLNELNLGRVDLVCHSFGARVGLLIASGHPERVRRLLITGGAGIRPKRTLRYYWKVCTYKIGKFFARLFGLDTEKLAKKHGSSDYAVLKPNERATFSKIVNRDLSETLPRIQAPTLLLWGRNDTATPLYMAHKMEKEIPDCALVELEGTHFVFLEQAARFNLIAKSFFKEEES